MLINLCTEVDLSSSSYFQIKSEVLPTLWGPAEPMMCSLGWCVTYGCLDRPRAGASIWHCGVQKSLKLAWKSDRAEVLLNTHLLSTASESFPIFYRKHKQGKGERQEARAAASCRSGAESRDHGQTTRVNDDFGTSGANE